MDNLDYKLQLYFNKLTNDVVGTGNCDLTIQFRGGSIRRVIASGQGNVAIPKWIDRKGAFDFLPSDRFTGTLESKVIAGTPVTFIFKGDREA
jgi:hypothetical protein